jgi:hypothetical protein
MGAEAIIAECLAELDTGAFPGELPEEELRGDRLPAVTFRQIGGGPSWTQEGSSIENPLWEVCCWAWKYSEAKQLAKSATAALAGIHLLITSSVDDRETTSGAWRIVLTGNGWFPEEDA